MNHIPNERIDTLSFSYKLDRYYRPIVMVAFLAIAIISRYTTTPFAVFATILVIVGIVLFLLAMFKSDYRVFFVLTMVTATYLGYIVPGGPIIFAILMGFMFTSVPLHGAIRSQKAIVESLKRRIVTNSLMAAIMFFGSWAIAALLP